MTKRRDTTYTLAFSGGGSRGYFSIKWFRHFVQLWGIPDNEVYKYYNVIGGTSAGGIIALCLAYGLSLQDIEDFFLEHAPWIFTIRSVIDVGSGSINASFPSNRPYLVQKLAILANNDQWYRSVDSNSNYGSTRLKSALTGIFGNDTLQTLRTNVIIPSFAYNTKTPILYSNLNYSEFIGQTDKIVDVAMSTAAPPIYLPSYNGNIDGGVYKNNPVGSAFGLSKALKKLSNSMGLSGKRHCVLSVGTGKEDPGIYQENDPNQSPPTLLPFQQAVLDIITYFNASINSAETNDLLNFIANYALENTYFYEANALLDSNVINTDLDNTDPEFFVYLANKAQEVFNNDMDNVSQYLAHQIA